MKKVKAIVKDVIICTFELISSLIFVLPRHKIFNFFKSNFLRCLGSKVGKNITFYPGITLSPGNKMIIGDNVDLAWGVLITTKGGIELGDRVLIGYNTQIFTANHVVPPLRGKIFESGHSMAKVVIEQDAWIGAGCIILPGVKIGEGSVVAAGSVVTKDVPKFTYVGGVPAKILKNRD